MRIKLAGPVCWGYRVALMSGSRRLWNQLLLGVLSLFHPLYLSRSTLALAASQAFATAFIFHSLYLFLYILAFSLLFASTSVSFRDERGEKDLFDIG